MTVPSELFAKRIVLVVLLVFLPTFVFLGLGAGILPYGLLAVMTLFQLRQHVPIAVVFTVYLALYSLAIYLISVRLVHLIYRLTSGKVTLALLATLIAAPVAIGSLPIFCFGGIRRGEPPTNVWHFYQHSYHQTWREIHPILGAFVFGILITLAWIPRQRVARSPQA